MWLKSTHFEPSGLFNSFCQRRGGRHAADSAARATSRPPPHTCLQSPCDPNTVPSSSRRPEFDPAPCLRCAYFKPFSSSHLSSPKFGGLSWQPASPPTRDTSGCSRSGDHLFAAGRASDGARTQSLSEPLSAACRDSARKQKNHMELQVLHLYCFFIS